MARMPAFMKQGGRVRPPRKDSPIKTLSAALAYFKKVGSEVRRDGDTWIIDHRGYSHGGVPERGLIHIANEDVRLAMKD